MQRTSWPSLEKCQEASSKKTKPAKKPAAKVKGHDIELPIKKRNKKQK